MDMASLTNQGQPRSAVAPLQRRLSPNLFVEVQYSARHLTLTDVGADTTDLINGTLLIDASKNGRYWSPTFCRCDCDGDEKRDNDDFVVKGSYFLSTRALGSHHMVFGFDRFNDKICQNAYASGSDYRIQGDELDLQPTASVYPAVHTARPTTTIIQYNPIMQLEQGSNLRMNSLFFNDTWRLNEQSDASTSASAGTRTRRQDGGGSMSVANTGF